MPDEFIDGMEQLAPMQGDTPWPSTRATPSGGGQGSNPVHILVSTNAEMDDAGAPVPELEDAEPQWLLGLCVGLRRGRRAALREWTDGRSISGRVRGAAG